jgi:putative membrane-bound dehydrogenase-like protein
MSNVILSASNISDMMHKLLLVLAFSLLSAAFYPSAPDDQQNPKRVEILFLGHNSKHHDSEKLADIFVKEYFRKGFNITYTDKLNDLNDSTLAMYDAMILYANYDTISSKQANALLHFVEQGKGFIPLHCASHCFRNSADVVRLIGGQFDKHGYDSFPSTFMQTDHPVVKNVSPFTTKDETYRHKNLSNDITVLTERVEGDHREPYTWVKTYGKGRVFYTAYGHDENTFSQQGFLDLVANGILWAIGDERQQQLAAVQLAQPEYFEAPIPNYEKRQPVPKVQHPLTAAQSMTQIQVPPGFRLELFASEPQIVNPIFMNWDERGRLWVIETIDYPNEVKDDDEGDDRIKILEDTDADGRADKVTVFAEKLNIPTSFVFVNGGIIVSAAPAFVFLKDTNGDDKADERTELLSGWGKFDTHAQASNLRYGLDNKIWGVVGYSGFRGKVGEDSIRFSNGLFRFTTDGKQLEHLSTTSNNTWGLGFSEDFDVFLSTANNTHTAFFGMPKKYLDKGGIKESGVKKLDAHYNMHVATKNLRQVDVHGGFTAAAGHSVYTARNFPREYWNRVAFVTEPTGRLVHKVFLKKDGAGFMEDGDGWNMMLSADEWAAPVQAEVGPDGALWIADWYDFIIQHNPTPTKEKAGLDAENGAGNAYITPLRDRERGRIYRLVYTKDDRPKLNALDRNNTKELLQALSSDNMFWRTTAQRLLIENNDTSVLHGLSKIVAGNSVDEIGLNPSAVHALWTMHALGAFDSIGNQWLSVAIKALNHNSAGVRRAAVDVLPRNGMLLSHLTKSKAFSDKDKRVRLSAIRALMDLKPGAANGRMIAQLSAGNENTRDEWLRNGLIAAAKINKSYYEAAARAKGLPLLYQVKGADSSAVVKKKSRTIDKRITIKVIKDQMKFDQQLITAKAGTTLQIILENPDFMQHNLVLVKPGTSEIVGKAADELARDQDGAKKQYIPAVPQVIDATPLVNPGEKYTLTIKVPSQPGDYPYLCTFPGHWRIMNGILRVTK